MAKRRGLAGSAAIMFSGTLVSRVLGLVRNVVLVAAIGVTGAANSFSVANKLPNVIYMLVAGGVLNAILVPQIVRAMRARDGGHDYVNRLLTLAGTALLGLTLILTAGSTLLVTIYAAELQPEWFTLAVAFALWCIPQLFFYGMYALLGQVLNAKGIFGPYMWAPVFNNAISIIGLVAYIVFFGGTATGAHEDPAAWTGLRTAVVAGTATAGVAVQALVLLVPLHKAGFRFRPKWGLRGSGLGRASKVGMWMFGTLGLAQVGFIAISNVAAGAAGTGEADFVAGNAAWDNANFLYMLPQSLITVSLVTALFTRVSDYAASNNVTAVRRDLSLGLRTIGVFTVFAAAALAVLALPLVQAVLPTTSLPEAQGIARVVVALLIGIAPLGAFTMVQRVYYAFEDTRSLFRLQFPLTGIVVLGCLGATLLPPDWWLVGAGAGQTLSNIVAVVVSYLALRRKLPSLDGARVLRTHLRLAIATIPAVAVGWTLLHFWGPASPAERTLVRVLGAGSRVAIIGLVMLAIYIFLLRRLQVGELATLLEPLGRLLKQLAPRLPGKLGDIVARAGRKLGADPAGRTMSRTNSLLPDEHEQPRRDTLDEEQAPQGKAPQAGDVLAQRYHLKHELPPVLPGATCWLGHDSILQRDVQVLVLPGNDERFAETLDSARRAVLVDDPRLRRILDVGDVAGHAFIVSLRLRGTSLAELASHGLPPDQARAIIGEAASALEAARRRGVHHLVLTPASIHVGPDGQVIVTGLGAAGTYLGLAETDPLTAARTDATGLIRLLYLALTGYWFRGEEAVERLRLLEPDSSSLPLAPGSDTEPVSACELVADLPGDLVALCAATLRLEPAGPRTPGDVIRELAPWPEITSPPIPEPTDDTPDSDGPPGAGGAMGEATGPSGGVPPAAWVAAETGPATPSTTVTSGSSPEWQPLGSTTLSPPPAVLDASDWRPHALPEGHSAPRHFGEVLTSSPAEEEESTRGGQVLSARHPSGSPIGAIFGAAVGGAATAVGSTLRRGASRVSELVATGTSRVSQARKQRIARHSAQREAAEEARRAADVDAALAQARAEQVAGEPRSDVAEPPTDRGTDQAPPPTRTEAPPGPITGEISLSQDPTLESLSAAPGPPQAAPAAAPSDGRIDPTPIVLLLFLLGVILAAVMATNTLLAHPEPRTVAPAPAPSHATPSPEEASPTPTPEETEEATTPEVTLPEPEISGLAPLDPEGDGAENPELTDQALDGDSSTFWRSRSYVDPAYGMKSGIGLHVELAEESEVTAVTMDLKGEGGTVEIRATEADNPTEGEVLAEGEMGPDTTFTFDDPAATDELVLWFTELPVADSDGRNRIELAELGVE